jgi:CHASE2 domain-containing sensor protein
MKSRAFDARPMEPVTVLIVLPVVFGVAAELMFRDTTRASLAAAILSSLSVYACLALLDPGGTWNGLATFLVSPLAIAFSLATVLTTFGHLEGRRRHHKRHA